MDAHFTTQKMKFSIKDFFSKCDQIRRNLQIWSRLLKKSLMENFIFRAVFEVFLSTILALPRWRYQYYCYLFYLDFSQDSPF